MLIMEGCAALIICAILCAKRLKKEALVHLDVQVATGGVDSKWVVLGLVWCDPARSEVKVEKPSFTHQFLHISCPVHSDTTNPFFPNILHLFLFTY